MKPQQVDIEAEMKDAYLQYSMSVIVGRALPDVRDGLKPVLRCEFLSLKKSCCHKLNFLIDC